MSLKNILSYNENYNFDDYKDLTQKNKVYAALKPVAILVCNAKFKKIEVHGIENIPKSGGFILASNHVSGFDPIITAYKLIDLRQLFFMAKEEHATRTYTRIPLLLLNGIPVKRGTADRTAIDFSLKVLNSGNGLYICPQGTRDKTNSRPEKAKAGVAMLAREAKADVIPMSVYYDKRISTKRPRAIIRFGEVIPYDELGFTEEIKARELKEVTKKIMDKICELWDIDDKEIRK